MTAIDWSNLATWGDPATCVHTSATGSDLDAEDGSWGGEES